MKDITVAVRKSILVNVGNYENVRIECEIGGSLIDEDTDKALSNITSNVDKFLSDQVDSIDNKVKREASRAKRFGL